MSLAACAAGIWAIGALLVPAPARAAPKTDTVHFRNGDRLTCEIQKLLQGQLTISTDALNTVTVHWAEVAGLESPREFDITVGTGERFFGRLGIAAGDRLLVSVPGTSPAALPLADVISLVPIGSSLWGRVDGNINAGFSFAQANLETHWTLNSAATYRSLKYVVNASLASQVTLRENAASLSRNSLSFGLNRLLDERWFVTAIGQFQQNEELQLELRSLGGGGFGREFAHSNHVRWSGFVGLVYTRERFTGDPIDQSAEVAVGGGLDFFTPRKEEVSFTNTIVSYYNATSRARARVEVQSSWRHQFLSDFNWSLDVYESFDSSPPPDGKRNDASISASIGWKF